MPNCCMRSTRSTAALCRHRGSAAKNGDPSPGMLAVQVAQAAMEVVELVEVAGWAVMVHWVAREAQEAV